MSATEMPKPTWIERAADRSPKVQRSRARGMEQARAIVDAGRRLAEEKGPSFTTQELVKEAGIALQTFYRYFGGKDQLLLAMLEESITQASEDLERAARRLTNPVDRLHSYVISTVGRISVEDAGPRGGTVVSEHARLHRLYPEELAEAINPFTQLILRDLCAARDEGLLAPADTEYDAWLVTQLLVGLYHHYSFANSTESLDDIGERVWAFCLAALRPTDKFERERSASTAKPARAARKR